MVSLVLTLLFFGQMMDLVAMQWMQNALHVPLEKPSKPIVLKTKIPQAAKQEVIWYTRSLSESHFIILKGNEMYHFMFISFISWWYLLLRHDSCVPGLQSRRVACWILRGQPVNCRMPTVCNIYLLMLQCFHTFNYILNLSYHNISNCFSCHIFQINEDCDIFTGSHISRKKYFKFRKL